MARVRLEIFEVSSRPTPRQEKSRKTHPTVEDKGEGNKANSCLKEDGKRDCTLLRGLPQGMAQSEQRPSSDWLAGSGSTIACFLLSVITSVRLTAPAIRMANIRAVKRPCDGKRPKRRKVSITTSSPQREGQER